MFQFDFSIHLSHLIAPSIFYEECSRRINIAIPRDGELEPATEREIGFEDRPWQDTLWQVLYYTVREASVPSGSPRYIPTIMPVIIMIFGHGGGGESLVSSLPLIRTLPLPSDHARQIPNPPIFLSLFRSVSST